MSHFALLDENNIVIAVFPGRQEDNGLENELSERTGQPYKQTSYNTHGGQHILGGTPFRKNYAGIGFIYDAERDAFIPPQPFASWTLNEQTCLWEPPVPRPADGSWTWNEDSLEWIEIE